MVADHTAAGLPLESVWTDIDLREFLFKPPACCKLVVAAWRLAEAACPTCGGILKPGLKYAYAMRMLVSLVGRSASRQACMRCAAHPEARASPTAMSLLAPLPCSGQRPAIHAQPHSLACGAAGAVCGQPDRHGAALGAGRQPR